MEDLKININDFKKDLGNKRKAKQLKKLIERDSLKEKSNLDIKDLIREQIEFYLSDSNLFNDQFLRQIILESEKQEVSIELLLTFNKMKSLLNSFPLLRDRITMIKESLLESKTLQVNHEKNSIFRKEKYTNENIDKIELSKRVIYVENIPSICSIELLKSIFEKVGNIKHISLPKYRYSQTIKGFAFIEFQVLVK